MIGRAATNLYALADYIESPNPLSREASLRIAAALRTAADEAARMEQALDELVGDAMMICRECRKEKAA